MLFIQRNRILNHLDGRSRNELLHLELFTDREHHLVECARENTDLVMVRKLDFCVEITLAETSHHLSELEDRLDYRVGAPNRDQYPDNNNSAGNQRDQAAYLVYLTVDQFF